MKRWLSIAVWLACSAALTPAFAAGLMIIEDSSWWHGPIPPRPEPPTWPRRPVPRPHIFAPLEISFVKVHTRINDQIAATAVDQEFFNPNDARLEGTFVFPIPKGAHLDKFTMEIDGKQVEAELLAAEKARHIYEDIVRKMRDPALLEYAGRDVFKVRIFPIEPHSRKRITLSYTQLLKADAGLVAYSMPLSTEKFSAKPLKNVSVKVDLETKRPLKSIYSPSHAVEIKREGANRAVAGYEASDVQPDADFTLYFAPEKEDIGLNLLTHRVPGEDGYFLLLASPGLDVKQREVLPKDVVFALDTSGSMAGKKLDQAKKALLFCIENLNQNDRFEILRFSTEVEPLFDKLVDATEANRRRAENFVQDLKPIGSTAIDDALKQALGQRTTDHKAAEGGKSDLSTRPLVVIFLTDGRPTIGTTDDDQILAHVKQANNAHTRVFCFGIGTDVNTHLLDRITEETRAFSQYVLPEEDLEVKVSSFFSKIKEPVLADPTLKFTGEIRVTKLYPSPLPDLFKGEQLVLVGRYSGQGDSAAVVEGQVNGAVRRFAYDTRFPAESTENNFISRLWATRRVGYLLDEIRLHGENSELRDEVTDLARKYGIVTPYTAHLIVEDETRRNVPVPLQSLKDIRQDGAAREQAADAWRSYRMDSSGSGGVAGAQSSMALKSANAPAVAATTASEAFGRRYGLSPAAPAPPASGTPLSALRQLQSASSSASSQYVAGKTFYQNDQQWIDSAIQKAPNATRIRLQFGSREYFEFTASHPQALPWLSLGQRVQFLFDNTIYEIYE